MSKKRWTRCPKCGTTHELENTPNRCRCGYVFATSGPIRRNVATKAKRKSKRAKR